MTKNTCLKTSTGIMCYATPSHEKKIPVGCLNVGDCFRYPSGTASYTVTSMSFYTEKVDAVSSGGVNYTIPSHQKVVQIEKEENTMDKSLHQIKGREVYGFPLATNSQGKVVFEVKNTGQILTLERDEIEKVMPYTIGVRFVQGNQTTYPYFNSKRNLKVGDFVFIDGTSGLARVVEVDTKCHRARKEIKGSRLQTEEI